MIYSVNKIEKGRNIIVLADLLKLRSDKELVSVKMKGVNTRYLGYIDEIILSELTEIVSVSQNGQGLASICFNIDDVESIRVFQSSNNIEYQ